MNLRGSGGRSETGKLVRLAIVAAALLGGGIAKAALLTCPSGFVTNPTANVENNAGNDTAVSACQYLSNALTKDDNKNVANLTNINLAGFFGFTDWTVNEDNNQVEMPDAALTGTWAITDPDFDLYDYIIVFKDGDGTNLVGFLFNGAYVEGVWASPFMPSIFNVNNTKDVSHYTIAQRLVEEPCVGPDCGEQEIPEPGTLALLGIGLVGAGALSRRRRKT